jgi:acyl-CoA synthetase (AMP-forming)/AMP-acid ligase II
MAATLWHRFLARSAARGPDVAMRHGDRTVTFAGLAGLACGWARLLPVAPGDRVVIAGTNGIDLAAAVPGIWAKGAIPVFVNADAPDSHLLHALQQTAAAALLADPGRALPPLGAAVLPLLPVAPADRPDVPPQDAQAPGSVVFTSGSTGLPKGVVQAAGTLAGGVDRVAAVLGYCPDDTILCPIPFAFDYGWGQLLSLLLGGWPLVLPEPRGAMGLCAAIAAHRPTVLAGVPAVFADLLSGLAPIRDTDRSSIRLITNTGSRIPDPVRRALVDAFPDAALSLNYGLTETYRSASLPTEMAASHPTSVGFALPGSAISVIRPDGTEAAEGETGEIVHRGAGVFLGYWGDPDRTAQVRRPDPLWAGPADQAPPAVFTGDLGHKDAEGRLYILGRRDRQMKSMGVRVSPDEIEGLLLGSGLVREAAVVARPNDAVGDLIVAVVSLPGGAEATAALKALKRHARTTMSPYMQPRDWIVLEALPRNPNGKVDVPALMRLAAASPSENGHG